jgi:hypothetical protein
MSARVDRLCSHVFCETPMGEECPVTECARCTMWFCGRCQGIHPCNPLTAQPLPPEPASRVCHCGAACIIRASGGTETRGLLYYACGLQRGRRACSLRQGFLGWVGQGTPPTAPGASTPRTYQVYEEEESVVAESSQTVAGTHSTSFTFNLAEAYLPEGGEPDPEDPAE